MKKMKSLLLSHRKAKPNCHILPQLTAQHNTQLEIFFLFPNLQMPVTDEEDSVAFIAFVTPNQDVVKRVAGVSQSFTTSYLKERN